jgi:hypothetical protein
MALKIKQDSFVDFSNCYCRIININPNSTYRQTIVKMAIYPSEEHRHKDEAGYAASRLFTIPGVEHTKEAAYELLKLRPEFEGCTDC